MRERGWRGRGLDQQRAVPSSNRRRAAAFVRVIENPRRRQGLNRRNQKRSRSDQNRSSGDACRWGLLGNGRPSVAMRVALQLLSGAGLALMTRRQIYRFAHRWRRQHRTHIRRHYGLLKQQAEQSDKRNEAAVMASETHAGDQITGRNNGADEAVAKLLPILLPVAAESKQRIDGQMPADRHESLAVAGGAR